MMRSFNKKILVFFVVALANSIFADQIFLSMPIDANGQSMGGTGASYITGPSAMFYNPAGLINGNTQASGQISHFILGNNVNASAGAASMALTPFFYVGGFVKALYLSESFNRVENFTSVSESLSVMSTVVGMSAALQLMPNLSAGVTAKYFRLRLGQEVSQSINADLGILYKLAIRGGGGHYRNLQMGLFIENLGPQIDYYAGAQKETQPINFKAGFSYGLYRWVNVLLDYSFSLQEFSSINIGGDFLPGAMFSPKFGMKMDLIGGQFLNYSMSFGGAFNYGKEVKMSAVIGTSLGTTLALAQTYVSVYITQNKDFFSRKTSESKEINDDDLVSVEAISKSWLPYKLVPYNSGYHVEKIQAIELSSQESAGFIERKRLMHRTAVQPEDEVYIEKMTKARKKEMHLTGRKVGIWMTFDGFDESETIGYWDICSAIIESQGRFEVLMGQNLLSLNSNKNSPKRVEFKLYLKNNGKNGTAAKTEIGTRLYEQYTGKIVLAKNFVSEKDETIVDVMRKISDFYGNYFSSIKAYYILRMKVQE